VAIHTDRLDAMIEEATERAERLKAELAEEWKINPGSSKQLRAHFDLENRKGWPTTPAGAPSTNQEAMKGLLAEEESVAKWLEWKEVEKIRSTYGESLRKRLTPDGRIHARFNPFGTATGRFSSSGPNLQNIPKRGEFGKRMRGLFWSGSDDRVLIKADYASIELWVAAVLWDDPHMQHALRQGVKVHVATAAALFNVKPGEVTKEQNSQTHHERFAGLDRAFKAPLRDMANTPCWGVVSQGCGFKVFKGAAGKGR
jgi:DNA polymerase I